LNVQVSNVDVYWTDDIVCVDLDCPFAAIKVIDAGRGVHHLEVSLVVHRFSHFDRLVLVEGLVNEYVVFHLLRVGVNVLDPALADPAAVLAVLGVVPLVVDLVTLDACDPFFVVRPAQACGLEWGLFLS
jgi:hypothetical protein